MDQSIDQNTSEKEKYLSFGEESIGSYGRRPEIHLGIATRWEAYALHGIDKEGRSDLADKHPVIKNCKFISPPRLNDEIRAV